jgi:hypothetical protein
MPRIRSIKPEFWKSEKVASKLRGPDGRQARLFFIALWNFAEDHGVVRGQPSYLKSEIFPYEDDVTMADVSRWLDLLESGRFIIRFERDGLRYLWIKGFNDHQKINRPSPVSLPEPTAEEKSKVGHSLNTHGGLTEYSLSAHGVLTEDSLSTHCGKGREGKGVEGSSAPPAKKPELSEQGKFYIWFQDERRKALGEEWLEDHEWNSVTINRDLSWVKDYPEGTVMDAVSFYLLDPKRRRQTPPCCLKWFSKDRADYLARAKRSDA